MAAIVNDRDVLIMGAASRFTPPTDRGMLLTPPAAVFKLSANGLTASPSSFTFTATLLNMTGTVTWSSSGGISLVTNGNTATLNFASFSAVSGTVTASITVDGQIYIQVATVTKVADGGAGPQGQRGNVDIVTLTANHAWSDSEAVAALSAAGYGAPQYRDLVRLYTSDKTFSVQKMYDGSQWVTVNYVYDGSVFVKNSISADTIDARGLSLKDSAGNVTFAANVPLAQQAYSNPNLCPTPIGMLMYGGTTGNRNGDVRFGDGQYVSMPPTGDSSYCGANSGPLRIPASSYYTVSFDVYCNSNSGRTLNVDIAGTGVDSTGIAIVPTTTMTRYKFSEQMPASGTNGDAQLRMFTVAPGGDVFIISNIKVELGNTMTPWCDSIITPANSSTFIQQLAVNLAQINTASIGNLSALTATIGLLRTAAAGARIELADNLLTGYRANNTRAWKLSS